MPVLFARYSNRLLALGQAGARAFDMIGRTFSHYRVIERLGAGGIGEVYLARDSRLGREVAINVLPAGRLENEDRRRRFVQEAQAASALNHPNIATIYAIKSINDVDFLVMKFVTRGASSIAISNPLVIVVTDGAVKVLDFGWPS
jgi:serine/threonine protein kinase